MRWDCKGPVLCHICACCFFNRGISFPSTSIALLWHWCSAGWHSCNFTSCTHARITKEKLQRTYLQPCELLCFRKVDTGEWWRKWEEKLEKSFLKVSLWDIYMDKKITVLGAWRGNSFRGRDLFCFLLLGLSTPNVKIEQGATEFPTELSCIVTSLSESMCAQPCWITLKQVVKK